MAPIVYYRQGNSNHCLGCLWATAMYHFFNGAKQATYFMDLSRKLRESINVFEDTVQATERLLPKYTVITLVHPTDNESDFDILMHKSSYPILLVLRGSDGSQSHAVSVFDGYIFDANCERGIKLSKSNLDWCVSSSQEKIQFVGIFWAISIIDSIELFPVVIEKRKTVHCSLFFFFSMIGRVSIAQKIIAAEPFDYNPKTAWNGLLCSKTGVFLTDATLKKEIQVQNVKLQNIDWKFVPNLDIRVLTYFENSTLVGAVLIGSWIFDCSQNRPQYVDNWFFRQRKLQTMKKLVFTKNKGLYDSYVSLIKRNHSLCFDLEQNWHL